LKVPDGTGDIIRANFAQTDPADLAPLNWYTAKKGDTLLSIAKKLKVNRTDLAEANYLTIKAKVQVGQRLIIPRAPELLLATRPDNPPPAAEPLQPAEVLVASNTITPAVAPAKPQQTTLVYRVKRGDTLSSIAKLYRTTVTALKSWNGLRSSAIQIGQRLTIFPERTAIATN
jgi:LysM repeat protein